jgi:hypothetical protein
LNLTVKIISSMVKIYLQSFLNIWKKIRLSLSELKTKEATIAAKNNSNIIQSQFYEKNKEEKN